MPQNHLVFPPPKHRNHHRVPHAHYGPHCKHPRHASRVVQSVHDLHADPISDLADALDIHERGDRALFGHRVVGALAGDPEFVVLVSGGDDAADAADDARSSDQGGESAAVVVC